MQDQPLSLRPHCITWAKALSPRGSRSLQFLWGKLLVVSEVELLVVSEVELLVVSEVELLVVSEVELLVMSEVELLVMSEVELLVMSEVELLVMSVVELLVMSVVESPPWIPWMGWSISRCGCVASARHARPR
ncbi:hypothetical protein XM38_051880 [Halomicronema hongdechloris C2206]|uniref:Uncharacterized protein n=1 Tax=Halomicronema hongdechloris C2206 TaxID=1641165 RepID=A0A1Z3HV98_9CYAN|nr:hypothetical protein [Halomicronema hongdechloris]ASC74213.1 hypothetical protein XM38_051880 [Halomicronema hongdechloris C2206]